MKMPRESDSRGHLLAFLGARYLPCGRLKFGCLPTHTEAERHPAGKQPTEGNHHQPPYCKTFDNQSPKSYPQFALGVILYVAYNVYQVGKSGKYKKKVQIVIFEKTYVNRRIHTYNR
ncbi:MAG: hypothetical protein WC735_01850 [Candidatus Paceibacterota bacterium]|jgi:hypothetical protein